MSLAYQHPMTQQATEDKRQRRNLPCSRLMTVEGMLDDTAYDGCYWLYVLIGVLLVVGIAYAGMHLYQRRQGGNALSSGTPMLTATTTESPAARSFPRATQHYFF